MRNKKVLVACEESQTVTIALRNKGIEAYSCDIKDASGGHPEWHIKGNAIFEAYSGKYAMMIAHPPCTYLCVSGNAWFAKKHRARFPNRQEKRQLAIDFFIKLYNAPIPHIAVENPVGVISTNFRKPDQYVQPYEFGDPHSKKTGFWLKGLPLLKSTNIVEPIWTVFKNGKRMAKFFNDAASLSPVERSRIRSKTFPGIAEAIASQWGSLLHSNNRAA